MLGCNTRSEPLPEDNKTVKIRICITGAADTVPLSHCADWSMSAHNPDPPPRQNAPELSQAHSADVQPVQENLTLVQLHHTEQGQEQGGLPGASASHDAHLLPGSHHQADPVQGSWKTVPVGQNHAAELQPALLGPRRGELTVKQRGGRWKKGRNWQEMLFVFYLVLYLIL